MEEAFGAVKAQAPTQSRKAHLGAHHTVVKAQLMPWRLTREAMKSRLTPEQRRLSQGHEGSTRRCDGQFVNHAPHPEAMEAHPGGVEARAGAMEAHPEALEAHPGAVETNIRAMEAHPWSPFEP